MTAPIFYLDTNVIRDNLNSRNHHSIVWVERIRKENWKCFTAVFAYMELLDLEQDDKFVFHKREEGIEYNTICRDRHQKDLTFEDLNMIGDKFRDIFVKYPFIQPVALSEDGWNLAIHIASTSNVFAPDVIHLAAAWTSNCNLLITSDSHFIKQAKQLLQKEKVWDQLRICAPNEIQKSLTELGFRGI